MSKFVVPNIFIAGTKAKAQEVNENFASIQDELEKKASKEGNENQTFYVANAIEDCQAISMGQTQNLIEKVKTETLAKIDIDKLSLFANSGNVNEDGIADLISFSGAELTFLVGNNYENLKGNIQGENVEISEIGNFNLSGFADGMYNIFIDKNGIIDILSNNVYIQPKQPTMVMNDIWVNTSIVPCSIKQFNGTDCVNFEKLFIGKVKIANSQIESVSTCAYSSSDVTIINQIHSARVIESYVNGTSWYRIWSDGWLEQGGTCGNISVEYATGNISFLKPFKDANYSLTMSVQVNLTDTDCYVVYGSATKNGFTWKQPKHGAYAHWYACGIKE